MANMIEQAISITGSKSKLCRAIDMSPPFLTQILKGERPLPARYALAIEQATDGKVRKEQLRPDIYPEKETA